MTTKRLKLSQQKNPYLKMPLDRVKADAIHGVLLARQALRKRDPDGAARELGRIIEMKRPKKKR